VVFSCVFGLTGMYMALHGCRSLMTPTHCTVHSG